MFPHTLHLPSSTRGLLDSAGPSIPDSTLSLLLSSFLKLLSTEGVGRLGSTKVKVEESLHSHLRYSWLYGWTIQIERCAKAPSPDPCSVRSFVC